MEDKTSQPNSPTPFSPSLKQRLKSTLCLPYPFRRSHHHHLPLSPLPTPSKSKRLSLVRTSSTGHLRGSSVGQDPEDEENDVVQPEAAMKERRSRNVGACSNVASCTGGRSSNNNNNHQRRRRHSVSADFSYDALSYSLNFDDGSSSDAGWRSRGGSVEFRGRDFSSRLPSSPPKENRLLNTVPETK